MINFKQRIANEISKTIDIDEKELESYLETPKDSKNGHYAFPCFRLAKTLKKAPPQIASEIKEKLEIDQEIIGKVEVVRRILKLLSKQTIINTRSIKTNR